MEQNKKVASLMIGMGVLAAGAIATQQTNEAQAATTTRKVSYTEGATTVWTSPIAGQKVKSYVLPNQEVQFVASKQVYSQTWLQTTDGGWVPEKYVAASTDTKTATSTPTAVGTVKATYAGGATTIWSGTSSYKDREYPPYFSHKSTEYSHLLPCE